MFSKQKNANHVIPPKKRILFSSFKKDPFLFYSVLFIFFSSLVRYETWEFLIFVFGIIVIGVVSSRWESNHKWSEFAANHSLQLITSPTLNGIYNNYKIHVEMIPAPQSPRRITCTRFTVTLPAPIEHEFSVRRRTLNNLNQKPVEDRKLDKLSIFCSSDIMLHNILSDAHLYQGLLDLTENYRMEELSIRKSSIQYIENEEITDTQYLEAVLRYLTDLANMIDHFDRMAF